MKTLELEGALPKGFQIGCSSLRFVPEEAKEMGQLPMKLTVLCLDEPSDRVAAVFTQNAFPGAPVRLGKQRMASQVGEFGGKVEDSKTDGEEGIQLNCNPN